MRASRETGVRERALDSFAAYQASGRPFGVLAAALDDRAILERVLGESWIAALRDDFLERLGRLLEGIATALVVEDGRVFVYLPGADVARTKVVADDLLRGLADWTCSAAGFERRVTISLGLASSSAVEPRFDPRLVLEMLEGVATEGLGVASDAGGERAVHSELYSFLQRGLERREPALLDEQARRVAAAQAAQRARTEQAAQTDGAERPPRAAPPLPAAASPSPAPSAPKPLPLPKSAPRPVPTELRADPVHDFGTDALGASFGDRLGAAVRELLRGVSGGRADPLVERSLSALVEARLEEERRHARAEADQRYGRQVDVLERRLAKLNSALDETERELQRAAVASAADEGAPSAYRVVQGLAPQDSQFELKRQLMAEIFSENLALARRLAQ